MLPGRGICTLPDLNGVRGYGGAASRVRHGPPVVVARPGPNPLTAVRSVVRGSRAAIGVSEAPPVATPSGYSERQLGPKG